MPSRRRARNVTWLPVLGRTVGEGDALTGQIQFIPFGPGVGDFTGIAIPVIFDQPYEADEASVQDPLGWQVGNEYLINRIVGKLHLAVRREAAAVAPVALITAGFFVSRASSINEDLPNGDPQDYGVNLLQNLREPWMWRKTWILGNAVATGSVPASYGSAFPASNSFYSDMQSGPHIDIKVKRRVHADDRLFFGITAEAVAVAGTNAGQVFMALDIRVLGQMRKARNQGTF